MNKTLNAALCLLARREYSAYELAEKLKQKACSAEDIRDAILYCQTQALQSDRRYAEAVYRLRTGQGYGPLRISQELQVKKIEKSLINAIFLEQASDWKALALKALDKKFKVETKAEYLAKQRFLLYRGFSSDIIKMVLNDEEFRDKTSIF